MACISAMVTSPLPQNTSTCSFSTLQFSPGIDSNKVTSVQITLDKRGGSAQLTPIYFLRPQELQAFEWIHFRNKTNTTSMIFYVILKWTDPSNKNANHVCRPNTIGAFRKLRPARRSASFRCRGSLGGFGTSLGKGIRFTFFLRAAWALLRLCDVPLVISTGPTGRNPCKNLKVQWLSTNDHHRKYF